MPVPRGLLNILLTLLLLLPLLLLTTTHNRGIAAITTTTTYCCCWYRLLFLLLPLFHFCRCHAVAYLAAPVVAINIHAETNVKYPAFFTDPPDHTEILQIIQIDPANRTDRILVNMYRSFRSHRFHSGRRYRSCRSYRSQLDKDVQITQIPLRYTPVKHPPHTDPSRLNMMQTST